MAPLTDREAEAMAIARVATTARSETDPDRRALLEIGLALWSEFGYGQPDEDSMRGPRPLAPDDPYWPEAAARVREHMTRVGLGIEATVPADRGGSSSEAE